MNMAPISSRKLDILPLRRAVKKESGTHINVWRDVENLKRKKKKKKLLSHMWNHGS